MAGASRGLRAIATELQKRKYLEHFDTTDPRNVINLLPKWVRDEVVQIPDDYFEMTEADLMGQAFGYDKRGEPKQPDTTSCRLRNAFWDEYEKVQRAQMPMVDMAVVTRGICSIPVFKKWMRTPVNLMWMLTPACDYMNQVSELHMLSFGRMRDIISSDPVDSNGKVDAKLGELQFKIFMAIDQRKHGAIVQKSLNVNANTTDPNTANKVVDKIMSVEEIEVRMKDVQRRIDALRNPLLAPGPSPVGIDSILVQDSVTLDTDAPVERQDGASKGCDRVIEATVVDDQGT